MIQPRPLGPRKTVQLMVVLTILAWATQLLFHQWGFGGVITSTITEPAVVRDVPQPSLLNEVTAAITPTTQPAFSLPETVSPAATSAIPAKETEPATEQPPTIQPLPEQTVTEQTVAEQPVAAQPAPEQPASEHSATHALAPASAAALEAIIHPTPADPKSPMLEVRAEATIEGSAVTLRQLCRWNDDDAIAPLADTVVARLSQTNPVRQIGVDEIKSALHDAGANLSQIQFAGSASCAVRRSEVDDATFARLISGERNQATGTAAAKAQATTDARSAATPLDPIVANIPQTPLFDLLTTDLSDRLKLPASDLEIRFDVRGMQALMQTTPRVRFDVDSQRIHSLGAVSWDVTIHSDAGDEKTTIFATALAWQTQVILTRPLSAGQVVMEGDVATRRVLVDRNVGPAVAFNADQVVGQELKKKAQTGDVLLATNVTSLPLILKDQFITVSIPHDGTMIETAARAIDAGARGDTIRARNEATNQIYSVVVTNRGAGEVKSIGEQDVAQTSKDSAIER